jgi:hypothetical protein
VSSFAKSIVLKLARRIVADPTAVMPGDTQKLARAVLLLMGEKP